MKEHRPGGGTLVGRATDGAAAAMPGKRTLTGDLELMQGGMATTEGGVLFSGPDPKLAAETSIPPRRRRMPARSPS
ncbi:MAG TPA: hypothetical protein VF516_39495 [Kofleriaceae bacterium]